MRFCVHSGESQDSEKKNVLSNFCGCPTNSRDLEAE